MKGKVKIAIIGGSGLYELFRGKNAKVLAIATPFGKAAPIFVGEVNGKRVAFLNRHARPGSKEARHELPPHAINYRANLFALFKLGVERIIATNACGSLQRKIKPGDFVILHDFIDFTKSRNYTFFDGMFKVKLGKKVLRGVVHVDVTSPFCPELREILIKTCKKLKVRFHARGVYVATEGPRFETPSEIKALRKLGASVVGMTLVPEVVLARELGMCYASIAIATNYAAGISKRELSPKEIKEIFGKRIEIVKSILKEAVGEVPAKRKCKCGKIALSACL